VDEIDFVMAGLIPAMDLKIAISLKAEFEPANVANSVCHVFRCV
jgi:hypothetical protein